MSTADAIPFQFFGVMDVVGHRTRQYGNPEARLLHFHISPASLHRNSPSVPYSHHL
jgi:hypothetical protein